VYAALVRKALAPAFRLIDKPPPAHATAPVTTWIVIALLTVLTIVGYVKLRADPLADHNVWAFLFVARYSRPTWPVRYCCGVSAHGDGDAVGGSADALPRSLRMK